VGCLDLEHVLDLRQHLGRRGSKHVAGRADHAIARGRRQRWPVDVERRERPAQGLRLGAARDAGERPAQALHDHQEVPVIERVECLGDLEPEHAAEQVLGCRNPRRVRCRAAHASLSDVVVIPARPMIASGGARNRDQVVTPRSTYAWFVAGEESGHCPEMSRDERAAGRNRSCRTRGRARRAPRWGPRHPQ
jgi:hypothetical protein